MPARFLLIDGYNLLHAAGMGQAEYRPGELLRCRQRLMEFLLEKLSPAERQRTTVVFDARDPPPDRPARFVVRDMQVLFANPGGDADVVIQDWLDRHSAPTRVTLVSSDRVLQRAARRRRAEFEPSEAFFERLDGRHGRSSRARNDGDAKPRDTLSPAEAERWLAAFGDLSELLAEEQAEQARPAESHAATPDRSATSPAKKRRAGRRPDSSGRIAKKQRRSAKRNPQAAADEVSLWMELFGNLPEAAELRRGGAISQAALEKWLAEEQKRHKRS